jgi:UDP-glucose 4-epimerase
LARPESRGELVNIGGTETMTILELAERIQLKLGIPLPLRAHFTPYETLPGNYQDVRDRVPDTTKAQALLGFEATTDLDSGLAETIAWHRSQRVEEEFALG